MELLAPWTSWGLHAGSKAIPVNPPEPFTVKPMSRGIVASIVKWMDEPAVIDQRGVLIAGH